MTNHITLNDLATAISTAKDNAYTLAATADATTAMLLTQCWERLDAALWCARHAGARVKNPQPDLRGTIAPPVVANPINAQP